MTCYEKIIKMLPFDINDSIKDLYTLDNETLKRVNRLGSVECENLSAWLAFTMDVDDFSLRVVDFLNGIEKPKLEKKLADLSSTTMWDRWNNNGQVSKRELSIILSRSVDVIEGYCRKGQDVYLKSYSKGKNSNVYFKKSDWEEYEAFLER